MDVFALFSDRTAEKLLLDSFPVRQTEKGLILKTTISSAELKESATTSINNTYLMLEKIFNDIPEAIGVCVYGFSSRVTGNSADLAFALAFLAYLNKKGIINSSKPMPLTIAVTGTITERLTVTGVGHIREKILAAVEKRIEAVMYPYDNHKEIEELKKSDTEFAAGIKKIRLIPVSTLEDVINTLGFVKTVVDTDRKKPVQKKLPVLLSVSVAAICLSFLIIYTVLNTDILKNNSKAPLEQTTGQLYTSKPVPTADSAFMNSNTPSPGLSKITVANAVKPSVVISPDKIESTATPAKPALSELPATPQKPVTAAKDNTKGSISQEKIEPDEDFEVTSAVGNLSANLMNSGFAASQGEWIYFTDHLNVGLYKMKKDGSGLTSLKNAFATHINVSGDTIYYLDSRSRGLFTMKTDGTGNKKINDDNFGFIYVLDNWVYYLNNNDNLIYKVNKNGLDRTPLCKEFKTGTEDLSGEVIYCSDMSVENNYIYFRVEFENAPDKNGIYGMKTDGSDKHIITGDKCDMLTVAENYIYYVVSGGGLYKVRKDGSGKKKIHSKVKAFNISNGLIYFSNEEGLFKMNSDGDFISMLTNEPTDKINIAAGWIYYLNANAGNRLYRIKPNGEDKQPVNNR